MDTAKDSAELEVGVISGTNAGCVLVRLNDGSEVQCGGLQDLHRKWGFFAVPLGQRVKVSQRIEGSTRRQRIVEIVKD